MACQLFTFSGFMMRLDGWGWDAGSGCQSTTAHWDLDCDGRVRFAEVAALCLTAAACPSCAGVGTQGYTPADPGECGGTHPTASCACVLAVPARCEVRENMTLNAPLGCQ